MHTLIGIDIQNGFVTGSLKNDLAKEALPRVTAKVQNWEGPIIFTQDTHDPILYKYSMEGKLPLHCCPSADEHDWEIVDEVMKAAGVNTSASFTEPDEDVTKRKLVTTLQKGTFGCLSWYQSDPETMHEVLDQAESITVIGFVSEICVIANLVILRAMFPNKRIIWDSTCSAGITKEAHEAAKAIARNQMIEVIE